MKILLCFLCIALSVLFISCDDQQLQLQEKNKGPVITVISPAPSDFYSAEMLIEATAEGHYEIKSMAIYIDNVMISSSLDGSISTVTNTTQYADGIHSLKITATDKKGTEAAYQADVTFQNARSSITLKIITNFPEVPYTYYYYLLDAQGKVISDLIEVTPSTTEIEFLLPAGHTADKKYAVAQASHRPYEQGYLEGTIVSVVTGYTEGVYNEVIGFPPFTPNVAGYHTVNFTNLPNPLYCTFGTDAGGNFDVPAYGSLTIPLSGNNEHAYIAAEPNPGQTPIYKYLSSLNVGEATTLDAADFSAMDGLTIPPAEGSFFTFSYVWGWETAGDYSVQNQDFVWIHNPYQGGPITFGLEMYYPGNHYPEYLSGMIESFSDHADEYIAFGNVPTQFKRLTARLTGVSVADAQLQISSTGEFDYSQILFGKTYWEEKVGFVLHLRVPDGSGSYPVPESHPDLVALFNYPAMTEWTTETISSGYIGDYSGLVGYADYFDAEIRNPLAKINFNDWGKHSREFLSRTGLPSNAVARMGSSRKTAKDYVTTGRFVPQRFQIRKP
jgi:hypothetical protein